MFIEVWQNGNLLHRHEVKTLPKGFGQQWYNARKAVIDFHLEKVKRAFPYASYCQLAFESRMNEKADKVIPIEIVER